MMRGQRIAIVPGSFDPVTLGHVDLIGRAACLFDVVWAAAMVNEKKIYRFSPAERLDMLADATRHLPNVCTEFWDGMLWQYAWDKGAAAIVKGIRTGADADYELEMARYNHERYPLAQTLLLPAASGLETVNSTAVWQKAAAGEDISPLVTAYTLVNIKRKIIELEKDYGRNTDC